MIKLEDEYTDIIKKAMIGTGISKKELCNLFYYQILNNI